MRQFLVEGINTLGISEQFHHSIGNIQIPLLGEDFPDVLFPEVNDKLDEVGQFLLGVISVVLLKLDGVLVPFLADFNVLVELLVVGVVQEDKIVFGDDRKVCESSRFLFGVRLA